MWNPVREWLGGRRSVDPVVVRSMYDALSPSEASVRALDGSLVDLNGYRGKALLIVNTASKCGYTPQYRGLEDLYQKYRDLGLVVLGFPSNDFMWQEPGTSEEIAQFCSTRYGVSFPMFEKVHVRGKQASPLYRFLASQKGPPKWNFHKYLISREGMVIENFGSRIVPDGDELQAAVVRQLE